jgi:hypothetical protein
MWFFTSRLFLRCLFDTSHLKRIIKKVSILNLLRESPHSNSLGTQPAPARAPRPITQHHFVRARQSSTQFRQYACRANITPSSQAIRRRMRAPPGPPQRPPLRGPPRKVPRPLRNAHTSRTAHIRCPVSRQRITYICICVQNACGDPIRRYKRNVSAKERRGNTPKGASRAPPRHWQGTPQGVPPPL